VRRGLIEPVICVVMLLGVIAFIGIRGEFPLNDDWNFALTTWRFADTGELVYSRFTAMTLKLQVLWGALWTLALGKSHEVLRCSSLALWIPSVLIVNRWLARLGVETGSRLLATAAFAFPPIVLWSSFTFMTQIPFLFCSVVALFAFQRALDDDDVRWGVAGAVAIVGAYFIRQTGVALAIAPAIARTAIGIENQSGPVASSSAIGAGAIDLGLSPNSQRKSAASPPSAVAYGAKTIASRPPQTAIAIAPRRQHPPTTNGTAIS